MTSTILSQLRDAAELAPIDLALAHWFATRDTESRGDILALTGALLSRERRQGHSGIAVNRWTGKPLLDQEGGAVLPERETWLQVLRESPLVGGAGERRPLIVDGERVYLFRDWQAEVHVAEAIRARAAERSEVDPADSALQALFTSLFPDASTPTGEPDWQAVAAAKALRGHLCLIAGGPGTGKTTTVARILALLLAAEPGLRVGLAAPTGKAAQRLGESIVAGRDRLPLPDHIRNRFPVAAKTLHRLLGYSQAIGRFTHGRGRLLPLDLLVVDEASMIDLALFNAVLSALPSSARLILLGDPDQLASVETGFVFGDLCAAGGFGGAGTELADFAAHLGVTGIKGDGAAPNPLTESVVTLRKVHRYQAGSGIAVLSAAVRAGRAEQAASVPGDARYPDVALVRDAILPPEAHAAVSAHAMQLCAAKTPEAALARLSSVQILSSTRLGPRGTHALNAKLEAWLLAQNLREGGEYFTGRPILVIANDYEVGLFNGDIGVCWKLQNQEYVCFGDGSGEIRAVPVAQLPLHESAWAMTVHKSQGSEFEHVVLVLPEAPAELLTRELVYTAVTRARTEITVLGEPELLAYAAQHPEYRESGLMNRLME